MSKSNVPELKMSTCADPSAIESWSRVKARLHTELGEEVFSSWFARIELVGVEDDTVRLSVPTPFLQNWITSHYISNLIGHWSSQCPTIKNVVIDVRSCVIRTALCRTEVVPTTKNIATMELGALSARPMDRTQGLLPKGSRLDPHLTLKNLVVSMANRMAYVAIENAVGVQNNGPVVYNPIHIYGGAGLGKTHFLHAAYWAMLENGRKPLYLTAEHFMTSLASAMKAGSMESFRSSFNSVGVLLVDDVNFIVGKVPLFEFKRLIMHMINTKRQVVFASNCPPRSLPIFLTDQQFGLGLCGGLSLEIRGLDAETRLEILKGMTSSSGRYPDLKLDEDVLPHLAGSLSNGREMLDMLRSFWTRHQEDGGPMTLELAQQEVRSLASQKEPRRITVDEIQRVVARYYNVSSYDIAGKGRTANVVRPRQVAMYLARVLTIRSLPEIGRRFGNRDHTTVLYGSRKIEDLVRKDAHFALEVEDLKRQLGA